MRSRPSLPLELPVAVTGYGLPAANTFPTTNVPVKLPPEIEQVGRVTAPVTVIAHVVSAVENPEPVT